MGLSEMGEAALAYANRGWAVFPLHTPVEGRCSCRQTECRDIGKHPRTRQGSLDASADLAVVERWWTSWPTANIAIACAPSNLVVIDIDPRHGGDESLRDLVEEHGEEWLDTVSVVTGGGGQHYYYRAPKDAPVHNSNGKLGPGIDVRGTPGGYVVAPPSLHASGHRYEWENEPGASTLIRYPAWAAKAERSRGSGGPANLIGETIPQGMRDQTMTSLAGSMRRRGASEESIYMTLKIENKRCSPPLPDSDLRRIARSIARYEPSRDIPIKTVGIQEYQNLRRIDTRPPTFLLEISGVDVQLTTEQLANHQKARIQAIEQRNLFLSPMKGPEWDSVIAPLLSTVTIIDAPDDASEEGVVWRGIESFLDTATDDEDRFETGKPLTLRDGAGVATNGDQLRNALRQRGMNIDQRSLWAICTAHGGQRKNRRIAGKQRAIWLLPLHEESENERPEGLSATRP